MCGRYVLKTFTTDLAQAFQIPEIPVLPFRYNIAPTQLVAAVRSTVPGKRDFVMLRWGLVPSWASDLSIGNRLINARSETVAEKPSFRSAFRQRRCLVLADGFYEWKRTDDGKQPFHISMRDGRPFAFAGLWENWHGTDKQSVESCTVLTTSANELMSSLHDRMPVILAPEDYDTWLDPNLCEGAKIQPLLRPYSDKEMQATAVSTWVNNPRHEDSQCLLPAEKSGL